MEKETQVGVPLVLPSRLLLEVFISFFLSFILSFFHSFFLQLIPLSSRILISKQISDERDVISLT